MPEDIEVVKAVYDTNIIVSSVLATGPPFLTLQLALSGRVKLFISPLLLEEYRKILLDPELQPIRDVRQALENIERSSTLVYPKFIQPLTLM